MIPGALPLRVITVDRYGTRLLVFATIITPRNFYEPTDARKEKQLISQFSR
jgi:hypothetical protein